MWELIEAGLPDQNTYIISHRLKVPDGWILRTVTSRTGAGAHAVHTHIVDTRHEWALEKKS